LQELHLQEQREQAELQKEQGILERQVRAAYAMGRQEQLKILLNQQDPAVVLRVLAYYDYLNRERIARMQVIRTQLQQLQQTRREIADEQLKLQNLQAKRTAEKESLEQEQQARRLVLEQLNRELSDQGRELSQLQDDEQQLSSLLQGLREALSDIPAAASQDKRFAQLQGALQWPVRGQIRHMFGESKIGGLSWDGVMIAAPEGNEVRAVHAGRVAFADWLRGFGLLLILDHGDGFMTLYGHNQSLFKEAGDWVEPGEPVAAVGSTGGRKEDGVYFAIRRHGKAVNPVKWCRRPRGRAVG
jgi:septal ring factor EnvC (AmiA/AmiB activator)